MGSLFYLPDLSGVPHSLLVNSSRASVGMRVASLASSDAGVIEGEVHFMMVPWSNSGGSERTKFKVSGVNTC